MDSRSTGWLQVGDRCFARRYDPFDVTVGAILGSDGVLLLDTRTGPSQAREILADLRELTKLPVRFVVNSHWHFDHTFGNGVFVAPDAADPATVVAHRTVPGMLAEHGDSHLDRLDPADRDELGSARGLADTITETFAAVRVLDLGDRAVELVHPGRGHTDGDIVLRVHDADVVYVGDLVEQSGPPVFGDDSYPLEWPATMEVVDNLLTANTAVVPGHGTAIDREFVRQQRAELIDVAETIRRLWSAGVDQDEALAAAESWPYPAEHLASALARGYRALRDTQGGPGRSLPVVS